MELKLYHCAHCGNIACKVVDKGVPMFCCGQKMDLMPAGVTDAAQEKHVPVVSRAGDEVTIKVGEVTHPMLENHYIPLIAAVTGDTVTFKMPKPGDAPELKVSTPDAVTAYEWCNLHGLWKGQE